MSKALFMFWLFLAAIQPFFWMWASFDGPEFFTSHGWALTKIDCEVHIPSIIGCSVFTILFALYAAVSTE